MNAPLPTLRTAALLAAISILTACAGQESEAADPAALPLCPAECDASAPPPVAAEACADGDPRTADRCAPSPCGGRCAALPAECDHYGPAEEQAEACDDGDACTADRCAPSGLCAHSAVGQCGGA